MSDAFLILVMVIVIVVILGTKVGIVIVGIVESVTLNVLVKGALLRFLVTVVNRVNRVV